MKSNSEIVAAIESAFERSVSSDTKKILAEISGDRVTLRGTVRSYAARAAAERTAWAARGVFSVQNQLTVAP